MNLAEQVGGIGTMALTFKTELERHLDAVSKLLERDALQKCFDTPTESASLVKSRSTWARDRAASASRMIHKPER